MNKPQVLSINELFSGKYHFDIPIYQRSYAWQDYENRQLIQDIKESAKKNPEGNYYLGGLVVYQKDRTSNSYQVIDGQQRLTSLYIALIALKKIYEDSNLVLPPEVLRFEYRPLSDKTLDNLTQNPDDTNDSNRMVEAYGSLKSEILKVQKELPNFKDYFLKQTKIILISLPSKTNLNHYFEIMNSRGEQLEPHEYIKAKLLEAFKDYPSEGQAFDMIWNACSNMNNWVQMNFLKDYREKLFGANWAEIPSKNGIFDQLVNNINLNNKNQSTHESDDGFVSLESIIKNAENISKESEANNKNERELYSVIDFPNFLLQVLQIFLKKSPNNNQTISLDDKDLITSFEKQLLSYDQNQFRSNVKLFAELLLRLRVLFDRFVIKSGIDKSIRTWDIGFYQTNEKNNAYFVQSFKEDLYKKIILLLSMFHVSYPSQNYKYWLIAVLYYLNNEVNYSKLEGDVKQNFGEQYCDFLETLAKNFLRYRYLASNENRYDFQNFIYEDEPRCVLNYDGLNKGTGVENFIFNAFDYILLKNIKTAPTNVIDTFGLKELPEGIESNFEFTYRNSVEHFYPQNPPDKNNDIIKDKEINGVKIKDMFGNLALISRRANSMLNNDFPLAKLVNYGENPEVKLSLKYQLMMQMAKENKEKEICWGEAEIVSFSEKAKELIKKFLGN